MENFAETIIRISGAGWPMPFEEQWDCIAAPPARTVIRSLGTGAIAAPMAVSFREEKLALQGEPSTMPLDVTPPSNESGGRR